MKDLGEASLVLSLEIIHDRARGVLFLRQAGKIQEILHNFGCTNVKPIGTSIEPRLQLNKLDGTENKFLNLPYHSAMTELPCPLLQTRYCLHKLFIEKSENWR